MRALASIRSATRRPRTQLMTLALVGATAAPALAAPPEQTDEPIFNLYPDLTYGLVVFWNITRDAYCAWEAGGAVGDPPVIEPVTTSSHQVQSGAIMVTWQAERPLELWTLDEGADLSGPCQDTDDSTEPWATGSAMARSTDNDLEVSGSRTNSFGGSGRGTVWDADGNAWQYGFVFRAVYHPTPDVFMIPADRTFLHPIG